MMIMLILVILMLLFTDLLLFLSSSSSRLPTELYLKKKSFTLSKEYKGKQICTLSKGHLSPSPSAIYQTSPASWQNSNVLLKTQMPRWWCWAINISDRFEKWWWWLLRQYVCDHFVSGQPLLDRHTWNNFSLPEQNVPSVVEVLWRCDDESACVCWW